MASLKTLGLVKTKGAKTVSVFDSLFPGKDYMTVTYSSPKNYVQQYWNAYLKSGKKNNSLNGSMFEAILATLFVREGLTPFYFQVQLAFVPAIDYDFVFYKEEDTKHPVTNQAIKNRIPIAVSLKTSLRERWKQADLEAEALKNVHRGGKCYLLSIEKDEVIKINKRIQIGDAVGLDKAIDCFSTDLDDFIKDMKAQTPFMVSQKDVSVIVTTSNLIK